MRTVIGALCILGVIICNAGADPLRAGITYLNFGTRLETTLRLTFPEARVDIQRGRCTNRADGQMITQCQYSVDGAPVKVRSGDEPDDQADYIQIFAEQDNSSSVGALVDISYLTALTLGADSAEATDLRQKIIAAAIKAEGFNTQSGHFSFELLAKEEGAFFAVFQAAD